MLKKIIFAAIILFPTCATADDQTDLMQKIIPSLQTQRNNALDAQAVAEGRVTVLSEQLSKANAKIKEFEDKSKPAEDNK